MLKHHLPLFAVNIFIVVLLWMFGVFVYIPLAQPVSESTRDLTSLVSSIFLIAIIFPTYKMIKSGMPMVEALAKILARKRDDYTKRYIFFKHIGFILLTVLSAFLIATISGRIHPLFSGIVLIISILIIFYNGFIALHAVSDGLVERIA